MKLDKQQRNQTTTGRNWMQCNRKTQNLGEEKKRDQSNSGENSRRTQYQLMDNISDRSYRMVPNADKNHTQTCVNMQSDHKSCAIGNIKLTNCMFWHSTKVKAKSTKIKSTMGLSRTNS